MAQSAAGTPSPAAVEVGDIFRTYGEVYRRDHPMSDRQSKVMRAIQQCRTAALGGHLEVCLDCGFSRPAYNSCRDRHCPKCQSLRQAQWLEQRRERLLPVPYFHVVFTLPAALRRLCRRNDRDLYATPCRARAEPPRWGATPHERVAEPADTETTRVAREPRARAQESFILAAPNPLGGAAPVCSGLPLAAAKPP